MSEHPANVIFVVRSDVSRARTIKAGRGFHYLEGNFNGQYLWNYKELLNFLLHRFIWHHNVHFDKVWYHYEQF